MKNCLQSRRLWFNSWVRKIPWRRNRLPTPVFLGFPCGSAGEESTCNAGDLGLIPGLGRSPGEGKGYQLQYSGLENSINSPRGRKHSDTTEQISLSQKTKWMLYNLLQVGSLHQWFGGSYWISSNGKNGMNWNIIWRSILPCQDYPWLSVINSKLY